MQYCRYAGATIKARVIELKIQTLTTTNLAGTLVINAGRGMNSEYLNQYIERVVL